MSRRQVVEVVKVVKVVEVVEVINVKTVPPEHPRRPRRPRRPQSLDTLDTSTPRHPRHVDTLSLFIRTVPGGVRFEVRVQPRASRNEVTGEREGALRVRLTAPPVEGAANEALIELLAKALHVAKRDVRIVSGVTARTKVVEIDGVTAEHVLSITPR